MLIALEGIDGIGKGTQARLLAQALGAPLLSFPRYSSFFGEMIGEYLNGAYGGLDAVHPKNAGLLYALDRWQALERLRPHAGRDAPHLVLDRYTASNLAHQGAKVAEPDARARLLDWMDRLEHEVLGIPRADLSILLDADPNLAAAQVLKKKARDYTDAAQDLHEADAAYLGAVRQAYLELAERLPGFHLLHCDRDGTMRPIDSIAEEVRALVSA